MYWPINLENFTHFPFTVSSPLRSRGCQSFVHFYQVSHVFDTHEHWRSFLSPPRAAVSPGLRMGHSRVPSAVTPSLPWSYRGFRQLRDQRSHQYFPIPPHRTDCKRVLIADATFSRYGKFHFDSAAVQNRVHRVQGTIASRGTIQNTFKIRTSSLLGGESLGCSLRRARGSYPSLHDSTSAEGS